MKIGICLLLLMLSGCVGSTLPIKYSKSYNNVLDFSSQITSGHIIDRKQYKLFRGYQSQSPKAADIIETVDASYKNYCSGIRGSFSSYSRWVYKHIRISHRGICSNESGVLFMYTSIERGYNAPKNRRIEIFVYQPKNSYFEDDLASLIDSDFLDKEYGRESGATRQGEIGIERRRQKRGYSVNPGVLRNY